MTLIPVSKTLGLVSKSVNLGADLWIGAVSEVFTGPCSSTGSPNTLNILPKVASPTGTDIGAPVSVASMPLTRPSVPLIATALTLWSPSSCWTSAVSAMSCPAGFLASILKAFKIFGNLPAGNSTSRTGPITWRTTPFAGAEVDGVATIFYWLGED